MNKGKYGFMKNNMPRNRNSIGFLIKDLETFVARRVSKENTGSTSR